MNFEQIKEILESDLFKSVKLYPENWMKGNAEYYSNQYTNSVKNYIFSDECLLLLTSLGKFECVEQYGGEGQGDNYYSVYHFIDHDVYIRFDGWYASHHGSEYNEMFEVRPVEKTITVYKLVNS